MQHDPFTHPDNQPGDQFKQPQIVCAGDCDAEPVEWLWPEKIPIGKVTLLIGDPGTGKSLVALDIAARASRLAPWPDESPNPHSEIRNPKSSLPISPFGPQPASVILLSATDDLADTIRPRLDAAGADPHRIFVVPSLADLRDDFEQLRAAVDRAPNCRLIIIDPINAYVGSSDSHFQTVVRKVLEPLAKLAAKRRIAVLAVAHLRKSDGAAIHRAAGSMGFVASARAVWTVCRDQNNPGQFLMLPIKNNLGPTATGLAYTIEPRGKYGAAAIAWHSAPITTFAEEALHSPEATDLNRARQWLRISLSHGPRSASEVTEEAAHYGFQPRTLRRALHAIGGNTQNRGLLEGWWWSLPETKVEGGGRKAENHNSETVSSAPPPSTFPPSPSHKSCPLVSPSGDFKRTASSPSFARAAEHLRIHCVPKSPRPPRSTDWSLQRPVLSTVTTSPPKTQAKTKTTSHQNWQSNIGSIARGTSPTAANRPTKRSANGPGHFLRICVGSKPAAQARELPATLACQHYASAGINRYIAIEMRENREPRRGSIV